MAPGRGRTRGDQADSGAGSEHRDLPAAGHRGGVEHRPLPLDDAHDPNAVEGDQLAHGGGHAAEDVLQLEGLGSDLGDLGEDLVE
jgi:hypothetical protein